MCSLSVIGHSNDGPDRTTTTADGDTTPWSLDRGARPWQCSISVWASFGTAMWLARVAHWSVRAAA